MILTTIPSRVFWILVSVVAVVALPSYLTVEAQRQDNRALRMQEVKELPAKSKRYALVIGVDEYQDNRSAGSQARVTTQKRSPMLWFDTPAFLPIR